MTTATTQATLATTPPPAPLKRGRGRPRIHLLVTAAPAPVMGRPRVHVSKPPAPVSPLTGKRQGRPREYADPAARQAAWRARKIASGMREVSRWEKVEPAAAA